MIYGMHYLAYVVMQIVQGLSQQTFINVIQNNVLCLLGKAIHGLNLSNQLLQADALVK